MAEEAVLIPDQTVSCKTCGQQCGAQLQTRNVGGKVWGKWYFACSSSKCSDESIQHVSQSVRVK